MAALAKAAPTATAAASSTSGEAASTTASSRVRRREGVALAYLQFDVVVASEVRGFPLVRRLLDLGIATDAWTVNPGPGLTDAVLRTLVNAKVCQITTDAPIEIARRIAAL